MKRCRVSSNDMESDNGRISMSESRPSSEGRKFNIRTFGGKTGTSSRDDDYEETGGKRMMDSREMTAYVTTANDTEVKLVIVLEEEKTSMRIFAWWTIDIKTTKVVGKYTLFEPNESVKRNQKVKQEHYEENNDQRNVNRPRNYVPATQKEMEITKSDPIHKLRKDFSDDYKEKFEGIKQRRGREQWNELSCSYRKQL